MRAIAACLCVIAGTACSGESGPTATPDGGAADAGAAIAHIPWLADGRPPIAPPELAPCPPGWRVVSPADGPATCEPWPESGYREDCPEDEAHLPGAPGCARIGTECPADGWPTGLPTDGTA